MVHHGGSVRALLSAGFASVDPPMARFYGLHGYGPEASLSGSGRLGILQQASFLSAHAHEDSSSPVKRGDFVLRRLLCETVKRPGEVGINIVFPEPVPSAPVVTKNSTKSALVSRSSMQRASAEARSTVSPSRPMRIFNKAARGATLPIVAHSPWLWRAIPKSDRVLPARRSAISARAHLLRRSARSCPHSTAYRATTEAA
jgi:Protein of unknown function (DUF1588)